MDLRVIWGYRGNHQNLSGWLSRCVERGKTSVPVAIVMHCFESFYITTLIDSTSNSFLTCSIK